MEALGLLKRALDTSTRYLCGCLGGALSVDRKLEIKFRPCLIRGLDGGVGVVQWDYL